MALLYAPTGQPKTGPLLSFPTVKQVPETVEKTPDTAIDAISIATGITTYIATDNATGIATEIRSPIVMPIETPNATSVAIDESINIGIPVQTEFNPNKRPGQYGSLDATHKSAEVRVYSILYRETISKKFTTIWTSIPKLIKASGIRSHVTVRQAIAGLQAKRSIDVLDARGGSGGGVKIQVYTVKEIFERRRKAGIEIDERTKNIVPSGNPTDIPIDIATGIASDTSTGIGSGTERPDGSDSDRLIPTDSDVHVKYNINPNGPDKPSSVPQQGSDDEKLPKVRKLFDQLSNGGSWKDERDLKAYKEIADINLFHITLGLCYSVSKSPEHKMSSLAYAVPSIQQHAADMDEFSPTTLEEIAYRTKRKTMNCIAEGKWSIPDWETGKE